MPRTRQSRGAAVAGGSRCRAEAPEEEPLRITVTNGDLTFEPEALLLGHYQATRLTGTEKVMDRLIGGAMEHSLEMGVYPVAVGSHQIFINTRPNLERGSFMPRPKAVIVVGLGEEGKLRAADLVQTRASGGHRLGAAAGREQEARAADLRAGRDAAWQRRHGRHGRRGRAPRSRRACTRPTRSCRTTTDRRSQMAAGQPSSFHRALPGSRDRRVARRCGCRRPPRRAGMTSTTR